MAYKVSLIVQRQTSDALIDVASISVVKNSHEEINEYVKDLIKDGLVVNYEKSEVTYVPDNFSNLN